MDFEIISLCDKNYSFLTHKSLESYFKHNSQKVIVYYFGKYNGCFDDLNVEVREVYFDFEKVLNRNNPFYETQNILIAKLYIFSLHKNFIFFESDVFFRKPLGNLFKESKEGLSAVRDTFKHLPKDFKVLNAGFVICKNLELKYTFEEILDYFKNKVLFLPEQEFICSKYDFNEIDYNICDVMFYSTKIYDPICVHMINKAKPFMKKYTDFYKMINDFYPNDRKYLYKIFRYINEIEQNLS